MPCYQSPALAEMQSRGFLAGVTSDKLDRLLTDKQSCVYLGIDPSAPSLHVGNLLAIMGLLHFRQTGHRVIALVGGATGAIGDPSGRSTERKALDDAELQANVQAIGAQLHRLFAHAGHPAESADGREAIEVLNNHTWTAPLSLIDFLASVGKFMRVGPMMVRDSVRSRINSEHGISFTEFSYQLLQAFDFWYLYHHRQCAIQIGGSDQWGNITAGIELIHKMRPELVPALTNKLGMTEGTRAGQVSSKSEGHEAYGITFQLLTTASGEKFGKSAGNAVWLDATMTSTFDFYQFFMRTPDRDVGKLLRLLTFLPQSEIDQTLEAHQSAPEKRTAQAKLADQVTALVHGAAGLHKAQLATQLIYGTAADVASLDIVAIGQAFADDSRLCRIPRATFEGAALADLVVQIKACKSKSETYRLAKSGGLYVNYRRVGEAATTWLSASADLIGDRLCVVRTGKANYFFVWVET
ncbi:tyrosyl-tRNA synthetase [Tieghemiomyces parasiticus]|uniref:Tyrosine--tRNA ligase n=1 Tax=Tieghemiomyces parasiticus TaxID=78921 RepID=A0A9W8DTW0_9FUNG|nr:tyrosyl-tRNA synthetase [Tieghemiomyces parasiticus]